MAKRRRESGVVVWHCAKSYGDDFLVAAERKVALILCELLSL